MLQLRLPNVLAIIAHLNSGEKRGFESSNEKELIPLIAFSSFDIYKVKP